LGNKSEDVEMGLQILGLPKSCPIYKVMYVYVIGTCGYTFKWHIAVWFACDVGQHITLIVEFSVYVVDVVWCIIYCRFQSTTCLGDKSINLSKYRLRMNILAGHLKGKALITTNTGKSCMEFSAKLVNGLTKMLPIIGHIMIGWNIYYLYMNVLYF